MFKVYCLIRARCILWFNKLHTDNSNSNWSLTDLKPGYHWLSWCGSETAQVPFLCSEIWYQLEWMFSLKRISFSSHMLLTGTTPVLTWLKSALSHYILVVCSRPATQLSPAFSFSCVKKDFTYYMYLIYSLNVKPPGPHAYFNRKFKDIWACRTWNQNYEWVSWHWPVDCLQAFVVIVVCVFRQQALFHVLTAYSMYNTVSPSAGNCKLYSFFGLAACVCAFLHKSGLK